MIKASNRLASLLHCFGVSGPAHPARVRASDGIGPSKIRLLVTLTGITTFFAFTAPALAATPPEAPTTITPAKSITATSAIFEGVLNPHTKALVGGYFAYSEPNGLTCAEGPTAGLEGFEGEQEVTAQAVHATAGLEPNAKYKFCLVAYNEEGAQATPGNEVTVETKPAPPEILGEFSSEVTSTSATLNARINPNNEETKYIFEYSTEGKTGTGEKLEGTIVKVPSPPSTIPAAFEESVVEANTGAALAPGTTYYYRVVAENKRSKEELKSADGKVEHFTTAPTPHTDSVTAIAATTATFNGDLTPLNPTVATQYHFLYNVGAACTGGSKTASTKAGYGTGAASEATPVTDLQPDTIYTVCFVTSHVGEANVPVTGAPVTFRTLPEAYVTEITSSSVTLRAVLDPEGVATTYRFQYGPTGEYGSQTPQESVEVSGAGGPVSVEAHLRELTPGSVYHYRVISTNAASETFAAEDQTFITLPPGTGASALADDRQYELVSPPDKHGALIEPIDIYGLIQASAEGDGFTYFTSAPTESEPQGNANATQNLSTRASDGWTSRDIATPNESATGVTVGNGEPYRLFSSDLSRGIFEARFGVEKGGFTTFPGEETMPYATEETPYLRENFACPSATCYTPLLTTTDVTTGAKYGEAADLKGVGIAADYQSPVGATPDLSHVVLNVTAPLTKATSTTPEATELGLYEWTAGKPAAEQLQFLSVLPKEEGGGPAAKAYFGSTVSGGESGHGDGNETRNAISTDGSRIVWSSAASGGGEGGGLYMRDTATEETVRLDAVQGGSGKTPEGDTGSEGEYEPQPKFDMASGDGSTVFFTDTQQLTADSRAGVHELDYTEEPDLYVCQMVEVEAGGHKTLKCDLTDLTPDSNPDGERAAVQGTVLGAGEDGSYMYFVADGVLGDAAEHGATPGDCGQGRPTEFEENSEICNLYVEHYNSETGKWEAPRFIATLSDRPDWESNNLGHHTSGASPDGHYLAFMSERDLTGYDTTDANSGESDEQVYLYDAATSKLVCASCNPTGARPVGEEYGGEGDAKSDRHENMRFVGGYEVWPAERWLAANIPGWVTYDDQNGAHQPRYLSNSGRLFFNSHDALVPQDVNGTWDVYQYEPPGNGGEGEGDCTTSTQSPSDVYNTQAEGCVGLISSGESSEESAFLDASESGGDVFFMTLSQLVGQDVDHSVDVYDAHECTAKSPCFPPAAEVPPPCTTEASCKAGPEPPPSIYGAPASATFNGPGNLAPPIPAVVKKVTTKTVTCKKGFVKKKVKNKQVCVKKKKKKTNTKRGAKR
jgi:hypothetical protein